MSEKPQKRLVSKAKYYLVEGKFLSLILTGTCVMGVGLLLLLATVMGTIGYIVNMLGEGMSLWYMILPLLAMGGVSAFCVRSGIAILGNASDIEKVEIVTPQNAHLLPMTETLVRPSDLPPSHQQAELLRAAPHGSETPAEELLRATTNRQGD